MALSLFGHKGDRMNYTKINRTLSDIMKKIIYSERAESLIELKINPNFEKILLYPTNDLYLSEVQFKAFLAFLNKINIKSCFLTQFDGGWEGIYAKENMIWELTQENSYEEYLGTNLYSLSMLFANDGEWAIFIEESLNDGIGLFVGTKEIVDIFQSCYTKYKHDLERYIQETKEVCGQSNPDYFKSLIELLKN